MCSFIDLVIRIYHKKYDLVNKLNKKQPQCLTISQNVCVHMEYLLHQSNHVITPLSIFKMVIVWDTNILNPRVDASTAS